MIYIFKIILNIIVFPQLRLLGFLTVKFIQTNFSISLEFNNLNKKENHVDST
jgi:hypothetical protein